MPIAFANIARGQRVVGGTACASLTAGALLAVGRTVDASLQRGAEIGAKTTREALRALVVRAVSIAGAHAASEREICAETLMALRVVRALAAVLAAGLAPTEVVFVLA